MSACELQFVINKIYSREPGLFDMILRFASVYYVGKGELQFGGHISSMGSMITASDVILICKGPNGIIFGRIDELTAVGKIINMFDKHKIYMNYYKECSLYLTGCYENLKLRKKLNGILKQYGMESTVITGVNIVRNGVPEFDIECFDKKEVLLDIKNKSTRTFNLMSPLEIEQSMFGLDEYGRPPYPKDGKLYTFYYDTYKWKTTSNRESPYYATMNSIQQFMGIGLIVEPSIPRMCSVSDCYDVSGGVSSCYGNCKSPFCSVHMPGDQCDECRM
jgi:hypothetical protein